MRKLTGLLLALTMRERPPGSGSAQRALTYRAWPVRRRSHAASVSGTSIPPATTLLCLHTRHVVTACIVGRLVPSPLGSRTSSSTRSLSVTRSPRSSSLAVRRARHFA